MRTPLAALLSLVVSCVPVGDRKTSAPPSDAGCEVVVTGTEDLPCPRDGVMLAANGECQWPLPPPARTSGAQLCAAVIEISGDGRTQTAPLRSSAQACGNAPGWYVDRPRDPRVATLCRESCTALTGFGADRVLLRLGCR